MEKYKLYLNDLGCLLKEEAFEAKEKAISQKGNAEFDFQLGYLMAFNYILSLMQSQAENFDIPLEEIGLQNLDPDNELGV